MNVIFKLLRGSSPTDTLATWHDPIHIPRVGEVVILNPTLAIESFTVVKVMWAGSANVHVILKEE